MAAGQGQRCGWSLGVPGLMHPVLQGSPCCLGTVPDFKPPRSKAAGEEQLQGPAAWSLPGRGPSVDPGAGPGYRPLLGRID